MIDETRHRLALCWLWLRLSGGLEKVAFMLLWLAGWLIGVAEDVIILQRRVNGQTDEALGMAGAAMDVLEQDE